jgi:hypothetical protein
MNYQSKRNLTPHLKSKFDETNKRKIKWHEEVLALQAKILKLEGWINQRSIE